jgi:predicted GNAT family acetyltransferase
MGPGAAVPFSSALRVQVSPGWSLRVLGLTSRMTAALAAVARRKGMRVFNICSFNKR